MASVVVNSLQRLHLECRFYFMEKDVYVSLFDKAKKNMKSFRRVNNKVIQSSNMIVRTDVIWIQREDVSVGTRGFSNAKRGETAG